MDGMGGMTPKGKYMEGKWMIISSGGGHQKRKEEKFVKEADDFGGISQLMKIIL